MLQSRDEADFYQYYFLEAPARHPYVVTNVFEDGPYEPPTDAGHITSVRHLEWGIRRFIFDAMIYWGTFDRPTVICERFALRRS